LTSGVLAALMGVGVVLPVVAARLETGAFSGAGIGVGLVGCGLIAGGVTALGAGALRRRGPSMPGGVRAAVAANVLFLGFFALEFSDRLVRQGGRVVYWNAFLFPPALLLYYGLLSARRWAWWTSRGLAAVAGLWFLGFVAVIPFADLRGEGGPVPWYGRVYMACVSLVFAGIVAGAYWSLGRPEARRYFGLCRQAGTAAAEGDDAPDRARQAGSAT
jgi:hypothetical protein